LILKRFLVVSALGEVRVVHRDPVLRLDEFAFRLNITIPEAWASIVGEINLFMPDPDIDPTVELDEYEE
jgi:hypothetical protein